MAAKPYDHDKSKYVENISHEMGHILGMFHDSATKIQYGRQDVKPQ